MKTRYSLVSNSSSSSFIVDTRMEIIASQMWKVIASDWNEDSVRNKKEIKKIMQLIRKACKRPDVLSGEIGIAFPCCNGPTYILRSGDKCYIETSNNHRWWDEIDSLGPDLIEADDDPVGRVMKGHFYYYVDKDLILHHDSIYIPKRSKEKLFCLECRKEDETYSAFSKLVDSYIPSRDGKKYCSYHLCELKNETNEKVK